MSQHDKQGWARVRKLLADAAATAGMLLVLAAHMVLPGVLKQQEFLQELVVDTVWRWGDQAARAAWAQAQELLKERGAEKKRSLPAIHRLEVHGPVQIVLRPGSPGVRVHRGGALERQVRVEVTRGVLRVHREDVARPLPPPTVEVYAPALASVFASGGSTVSLEGISGESLEVWAHAGAIIRGSRLRPVRMQVVATGGSRVSLEGERVEVLRLHLAGESSVAAAGLPVRTLEVQATGGSHVEARVETRLEGQLAGRSHLAVRGSPPREQVRMGQGAHLEYL